MRTYLLLLLLSILGCSDIKKVKTGELLIAPDEVLFRAPERGSRVSRATVEVRNIGQGDLALVGMRLVEQDDTQMYR